MVARAAAAPCTLSHAGSLGIGCVDPRSRPPRVGAAGRHVEAWRGATGRSRRECQEETGLIPGRLDYLGACCPTSGYCDGIMHFYRATELRKPGVNDPVARRTRTKTSRPAGSTVTRCAA
jgi:hypothetical protein